MNVNTGYVLFAGNHSNLKKWRATILHRGAREAKPIPIIAKCFAESVIGENQTINKQYINDQNYKRNE